MFFQSKSRSHSEMGKIKVTVLFEGAALSKQELADPGQTKLGLSLLVEEENGETILLDIGPSSAADWLKTYGEQVQKVSRVFISHGHFDHMNGLEAFLQLNNRATVYMHRNAMGNYYLGKAKPYIYIGWEEKQKREVYLRSKDRLIFVDKKCMQITDNIFVLALSEFQFARPKNIVPTLYERLREGDYQSDAFNHEVLVVLKQGNEMVLYSGCSHSNILNIIDAAKEIFPETHIKAVFGGFHLTNPVTLEIEKGEEEVRKVGEALKQSSIEKFYTGHCTGRKALEMLQGILGKQRLIGLETARVFELTLNSTTVQKNLQTQNLFTMRSKL